MEIKSTTKRFIVISALLAATVFTSYKAQALFNRPGTDKDGCKESLVFGRKRCSPTLGDRIVGIPGDVVTGESVDERRGYKKYNRSSRRDNRRNSRRDKMNQKDTQN